MEQQPQQHLQPMGLINGILEHLGGLDGNGNPSSTSCLPGDVVLSLGDGAELVLGEGLCRRRVPARRLRRNGTGDKRVRGGEDEQQQNNSNSSDENNRITMHVTSTVAGVLVKDYIAVPVASSTTNNSDSSSPAPTTVMWPKYSVVSATAVRYIPKVGDPVVGTVVRAVATSYAVSLGAAQPAFLDALGFDGATKQSRPRLNAGDLVYCHVTSAGVDTEAEVSCLSPPGVVAKDWVTGEGTYGPLRGGAMVSVPLRFATELLLNASPVLAHIGRRIPLEAAVGVNGRVWISTGSGVGESQNAGGGASLSLQKVEGTRRLVAAVDIVKAAVEEDEEDVSARVAAAFPMRSDEIIDMVLDPTPADAPVEDGITVI